MIVLLRQAAYKHGYLIITAAWLYTISFIFSNYWSYYASPEKVRNSLEQNLQSRERKFAKIANNTTLLASFVNHTAEEYPLKNDIGLFIYRLSLTHGQPPEMVYWNTNSMQVEADDIDGNTGSFFISTPSGYYELIRQKSIINGTPHAVLGMIPVYRAYFMENKYLQSDFHAYNGLGKQYEISADPSALPVKNEVGRELFRIRLKEGTSLIAYDSITILLRVLASILLLIFLHALAQELVLRRNFRTGFYFLVAVVAVIRLITYQTNFPFDFSRLPLFDPSIYASNFLHPTLGDLLINAVLLFWLVGFYKTYQGHQNWLKRSMSSSVYNYGNILLLTIMCFLLGGVIISLVRDSKISFDVTNIFSITVYSVLSIILLCFLVLSFFYFSQILLKPAITNGIPIFQQLVVVAVSGTFCLLLFTIFSDTRMYLWLLVWLILYVALLNLRKQDIGKPILQSSFFIFWVMLFAMSIGAIVVYENKLVEFGQRKSIAEKLALQTDPSGENLLSVAATNFNDSFLVDNFYRLAESEYSNKFIKDSLINQNFSGYLNKYDTKIYTFDSLYHPLFNEDSTSYASIKTILLNKAKPSALIPDLYSYNNAADGFSYLYAKEIKSGDTRLGYLFVTIKLTRYKSEALYPELFNQAQDLASGLNANYAYAVYAKGKLVNHFNTYNFPSQLDKKRIPDFEFSFRNVGDYNELWYNSGNDKQVLIVKRNTWFIEAITLFAYLFCSFLCIILLFHLGAYALRARFNLSAMRKMMRLNIRSQIQVTIIFLNVFSFLVIGVATISFFILRFNRGNEERLSKSIQVMANEVNRAMNALQAFDDVPDNLGVRSELEKTIAEISDLHNVDINYYNLQGNLVISTQPYIYNKYLLSVKMESRAYHAMQYGYNMRYLQSEKVGSFEYLSIYVPLMDAYGNKYAYLNIPYLNSQNELNQEISGFLATLINLNAFIFLIAGAIAFFLTSRITDSFGLIGNKMREMNLGKINEEIQWNRNDEIGMLVEEYNKMVKKLEQGVQALAQSEREGAWREMARQVAHEIKNPLTPMKLSIQYLQNAIRKGAPNVKELSESMAITLIEQINQLAQIAGDFSQFANIGNAQLEKFDITEILSSLIQLYRANPRIQIEWYKENGAYETFADRVQMNRLFTNLFQNAIEANEDIEKKVKIFLHQKIEDGFILVAVKDESGGIPEMAKENIFKPNFTTKSSGTGLGLAIVKGIVEKANGQIWFETEEGSGTTFFIQLPRVID